MFATRGFHYDYKKKLQFNANIFLRYALQRFSILKVDTERYYIYNYSLGCYENTSEIFIAKIFRETMHEAVNDIYRKAYRMACIDALPLMVPNLKQMNEDKRYINLENGMLNLDTMELEDHSPKFYSSTRIPIYYKPGVVSTSFERFLTEIMDGDPERIAVIEEMLGYFLTADTRAEKFFIWYGSGGNGKSLLSKIARVLCGGENVVNISISDLGEKFGLSRIQHKTLNISNENGKIANGVSVTNIKAIASGDSMGINVKYEDGFDYSPICKLAFLVNSLPDVTDNTDGFYRKALIIPFYRKFEANVQDKGLYEELLKEKEGILMCALNGLKRLRANKYRFTDSKVCNDMLTNYEKDNNPLIEFIGDCLSLDSSESVSKKDVMNSFKDWANSNGREDLSKMSAQTFWGMFKLVLAKNKMTYSEKKNRGVRKIEGFRLIGNGSTESIANASSTTVCF